MLISRIQHLASSVNLGLTPLAKWMYFLRKAMERIFCDSPPLVQPVFFSQISDAFCALSKSNVLNVSTPFPIGSTVPSG